MNLVQRKSLVDMVGPNKLNSTYPCIRVIGEINDYYVHGFYNGEE